MSAIQETQRRRFRDIFRSPLIERKPTHSSTASSTMKVEKHAPSHFPTPNSVQAVNDRNDAHHHHQSSGHHHLHHSYEGKKLYSSRSEEQFSDVKGAEKLAKHVEKTMKVNAVGEPVHKDGSVCESKKQVMDADENQNHSEDRSEPINPSNPLNVLQTAVGTAQQIHPNSLFQKILNFRDIADGDPNRLKHGQIYRSGLIHMATDKDFETLKNHYGIKTTIDLRSSDEVRQYPCPLYEKHFPTNREKLGKSRVRVHVPLWKATMNFKMLIEAKKYKTVAQVAMYFAKGDMEMGVKTLLSEMNEVKLPGMYKCFVKYIHPNIRDAIEICSNPQNYPILIHCSLGKDRTGVMSALVSDILGIKRDVIFDQYSKSADNLFPVREETIANLARYYLEPWLAESPREVMEDFFGWLETTYGSLSSFYEIIGVAPATRRLLLSNMTANHNQGYRVGESEGIHGLNLHLKTPVRTPVGSTHGTPSTPHFSHPVLATIAHK